MSLSNVYVYFPSKYKLLFEVYDPWMTERLDRLERETMEIHDPEARVRHIIVTLWRNIPAEQSGFARNVMRALTVAIPNKEYDPSMIR